MLTLLIGFILFFVNPTAGVVGLIALALKGSYFLGYVVTWAIEIAVGILFWLGLMFTALSITLFN